MNSREKSTGIDKKNTQEQTEKSAFSHKTDEYLDRIKAGKETIEQVLSGITPDGPIYNAIKEKFYAEVPFRLREKSGRPLPYPELEAFLPQQTLTTDEEENTRNKRVRIAILKFSEADWEKEEHARAKESEKQERIADLKKGLGVEPEPAKTEDVAPQPEVEISEEKKIQLEKNIQLPEMHREYDQEAIGDLNGSHEGLIAHLENRDLASLEGDKLTWKAGDKKVVFIGDILGDRTPEGLKIYTDLIKLKEQAQKAGGDVVWLSGNHENMFNATLCGFSTEFGGSVADDMQKRLSQYAGNLELAEFLPESQKNQIIAEFLGKKGEILETIKDSIMRKERTLKFMRSSPENYNSSDINLWVNTIEGLKNKQSFVENADGSVQISELLSIHELLPKKSVQNLIGNKILEHTDSIKETIRSEHPEIIESIKQQQLIQIQDDVLYTHTNLTTGMVELLLKNMNAGETLTDSANKLNTFYKYCLGSYIDGKASELSPTQTSSFNKIRDAFISTSEGSRINFSEDPKLSDEEKEDMKKKLKALGVNLVIHGHNDEEGDPKGSSELPIISIDRSAYKSDSPKNYSPTSAGAISKKGSFSYF